MQNENEKVDVSEKVITGLAKMRPSSDAQSITAVANAGTMGRLLIEALEKRGAEMLCDRTGFGTYAIFGPDVFKITRRPDGWELRVCFELKEKGNIHLEDAVAMMATDSEYDSLCGSLLLEVTTDADSGIRYVHLIGLIDKERSAEEIDRFVQFWFGMFMCIDDVVGITSNDTLVLCSDMKFYNEMVATGHDSQD